MLRLLIAATVLCAGAASSGAARAKADVARVARQFGIIPYNIEVGGIRACVAFMAKAGALKNPPADWKDMFFPAARAGS